MKKGLHTLRSQKCDLVFGGTRAWHYRLRGGIEVYIRLDDGRVVTARVPTRSIRKFVEEEAREA